MPQGLGLRALVLALVTGAALTCPRAAADFIVVPGAQAADEGNSGSAFPFNISAAGLSSQRYQQVYAAAQFGPSPGPLLITQIAFRPDAFSGSAFASTLPDVQINLSTTQANPVPPFLPGAPSATFANNVGVDERVVFRGALTLASAFTGPADGPKDFDIVINLQAPFLYDPALGNLLLDVRNFGGGSTTAFDGQAAELGLPGPPIASVVTAGGQDVGSPSGTVGVGGLVTRFSTTAIPEPAALVLFTLGALGLFGRACRRRKRCT